MGSCPTASFRPPTCRPTSKPPGRGEAARWQDRLGGGPRARARAGARRHDLVRQERLRTGVTRRQRRGGARSGGRDLRDYARHDELGAGRRGRPCASHARHQPDPACRRHHRCRAAERRDLGNHARPRDARGAVRARGLDPRRRAAPGSTRRYARRARRDAGGDGAGDLRGLRRHGAARDRRREHASGLRGRLLARRPAAAHHDLRRSDGVRGEQAAGPGNAPGVRRGDECPGLHARAAVLRGAMGAGAGPGARPPLDPGRGPGWAKLAEAVALRVPPSEIETIYLFRPWKREGREWGTAVVACRAAEGTGEGAGGRLRVYTARYMLIVRGKERGQSRIEVEETALSPADVIARVMQAAAERTGDPEPPVAVGPAVWYEG